MLEEKSIQVLVDLGYTQVSWAVQKGGESVHVSLEFADFRVRRHSGGMSN